MVSDNIQLKRLKEYGINIKTYYFDNGLKKQRNTDNSLNQDIEQGIVIEKNYYKDGKFLKKETNFDSRIFNTYKFNGKEKYKCKNCGMEAKIEDFSEGCPYCNTNYNIDYDEKKVSSKNYYDYIIKDKRYIIKTYIIDFIVCFLLTFIYIFSSGRTFYFFDILKIIVLTILLSFILFYLF